MSREKMIYPAREAREKAGFTVEAAADRMDISPAYLLRLERTGFPFHQAEFAARLYGAPLTAFMRPWPASTTPLSGGKSGRKTGERARRRPAPRAGVDFASPSQSEHPNPSEPRT